MNDKSLMGRWELSCFVINSLIYKAFTTAIRIPISKGGSAGFICSILSGIIFLLVLWLVLKIYEPYSDVGLIEAIRKKSEFFAKAVSFLAVIYFALSVGYALYLVCSALKIIAYPNSPILFTAMFLIIGAGGILFCGGRAVRRLHSLMTIGGAVTITAISLLSFIYADIYNLTPIFGKGGTAILKGALSTLFIYSDILIIFFLPKKNQKYSFSKTVFVSACIAVAVNVLATIAFSLNMPYELSEKISIPLYPLTKTANLGKFPVRLDAVYQISTIVSSILYVSLGFMIIKNNIKSISKKIKKLGVVSACLLLCFTLCGCYDASEVEERGYIVALGIDKGDAKKYKYTFQISNPLGSGGSIGTNDKGENKTVDNIVIEADNFYIAEDKLKSILSKKADMSHLKLLVYSVETARDDSITHSEMLLYEREVRPGTNLCLTENASEFLLSVKPTLEESTVRYYELFFRNYDIPLSPVSELRDFVGRSRDSAYDAVMPIAQNDGLFGMGVFSDGILIEEISEDEVIIYKMLCGDLKKATLNEDIKNISSKNKPQIKIQNNEISINLKINADDNTINQLEEKAEEFLYKMAQLKCDVLGLGRYEKRNCLTQKEWESLNFKDKLPYYNFSVKISV